MFSYSCYGAASCLSGFRTRQEDTCPSPRSAYDDCCYDPRSVIQGGLRSTRNLPFIQHLLFGLSGAVSGLSSVDGSRIARKKER
jgi:hypothetical protein